MIKLSILLKTAEEELVSLWLCDKIMSVIGDDTCAELGLNRALNYLKK